MVQIIFSIIMALRAPQPKSWRGSPPPTSPLVPAPLWLLQDYQHVLQILIQCHEYITEIGIKSAPFPRAMPSHRCNIRTNFQTTHISMRVITTLTLPPKVCGGGYDTSQPIYECVCFASGLCVRRHGRETNHREKKTICRACSPGARAQFGSEVGGVRSAGA